MYFCFKDLEKPNLISRLIFRQKPIFFVIAPDTSKNIALLESNIKSVKKNNQYSVILCDFQGMFSVLCVGSIPNINIRYVFVPFLRLKS